MILLKQESKSQSYLKIETKEITLAAFLPFIDAFEAVELAEKRV